MSQEPDERPERALPLGGSEDPESFALHRELVRVSPALGDLYVTACSLIRPPSDWGRLLALSHCVREFTYGLARALGDQQGINSVSAPENSEVLSDLVVAWEEADLPLDVPRVLDVTPASPASGPADPAGGEDPRPRPIGAISIPEGVFRAAQRAVQARRGQTNARRKHALVATGRLDDTGPTTQQLTDCVDFFEKYRHLGRADSRPLPSADEIVEQFERLERVVAARLSDFFEVRSDVRELLAEANRPRDDHNRSNPERHD